MILLVILATFTLSYHSLLKETKLLLQGAQYLLSHGHLEGLPPAPTYGWSSKLYHPSQPTIVTKPIMDIHSHMAYHGQP